VTGAIWALALVASVGIITFGIYMVAKITPDLAIKVRKLEGELATANLTIQEQSTRIRQLQADLQTEKNRKIHEADAT